MKKHITGILTVCMALFLFMGQGLSDDSVVYNTATIEDNFTDDIILVTLMEKATFSQKSPQSLRRYTSADFSDLGIANVTEITEALISRAEQQARDGDISKTDSFRRILKLELEKPSKQNVLDKIRVLQKREDIRSAEPNFIGKFSSITPNAIYAGSQWAINNMQLTQAWGIAVGSSTVVRVGIADSGIDRTHPDLAGRINEGLSRDHSGGGNPWWTTQVHGTFVAGIVASNDIGVAGANIPRVTPTVELVSQKVGNAAPTAAAATAALIHAEANNIRIINKSFNVNETTAMNDAINAYNGVIIAAAGNDGNTNVGYPARLNNPKIISVGSIDSNNERSPFSCWSATTVDLFAPGGNILSTLPRGNTPTGYRRHADGYAFGDGTSFAAPMVTGVIALMYAAMSPHMIQSPASLRQHLLNSADRIPSLNGLCVTGGKLNAHAAVRAICGGTINFNNQTVTNNTAVTNCGTINAQNTRVTPSGKLELRGTTINIGDGFTVEQGGSLTIEAR